MTLIETTQIGPTTAEQIYEIRTLAESGQFADALIRLRKIKPLYPRNTFLVAMEKQLERLLVLPRDSEPAELQKKTLLSSLPGLAKGAIESLRQQTPARPTPNPVTSPAAKPERADRDAARAQLKEQYFQHADEYLKKGAYGSALVEIRRVKIIAPDDPTVMEYERTIRQLVELQQRTGVRTQEPEQQASTDIDSPRTGVETSPNPAPQGREQQPEIRTYGADEPTPFETPESPTPKKSRLLPIVLSVVLVISVTIVALVTLSSPDSPAATEEQKEPAQAAVPAELPKTDPMTSPASEMQSQPAASVEQHMAQAEPVAQEPQSVKPTPVEPAPAKQTAPVSEKQVPAVPASQVQPAMIDRDPQIIRLEEPVFNTDTPRSSTAAEVIIMVQIDPDGKPIKTLIAKSTNPAYNSAIVTAVLRSTYRPGTNAEGRTTKWITIPYSIK